MTTPFIAPVVGVSFRQDEVRSVRPGDEVVLSHQPDNPHDANAIAVYSSRGVHIGYLPARLAARFQPGTHMPAEVVEVLAGETWGLRIRVTPTGLTSSPRETEETAGGPEPRPAVYAKSGRYLGRLVKGDEASVLVAKDDGTEVRFPAGVVEVASTQSAET